MLENSVLFTDIDNPPDPARVIEGLRDTGYDFKTAIADIVDNSVAANAKLIDIRTELDPNCDLTIYICDNGCGMNEKELINAMRYGSDRRPDPRSLGKFGLGLKTASTAFCRKLSLVSRGSDNQVHKVQWDLDYVAEKGWMLKTMNPTPDELDLLDSTVEGGTGTLVIWENIDRLQLSEHQDRTAANKALNRQLYGGSDGGLIRHLEATYQRFLDPSYAKEETIVIRVNGEELIPWDPFCLDEKETEPLQVKPDMVEITMPNKEKSSFSLMAYAVPPKNMYSSKKAQDRAHVSIQTMGFYVYRENRLIYVGDLGMFVKDPHLSLLRIDFSFDHTLDDALNIDIKKSRISLQEEIYNWIHDKYLPPKNREAKAKYNKRRSTDISNTTTGAHTASNNNIAGKAAALQGSDIQVTNPDKNEVELRNPQGSFTHRIKIQKPTIPGECFVVPVDSLESGFLWEPGLTEGKHSVLINKSHPYYQKVYYPVLKESTLITGMDALLWSLAESELCTVNDEVAELYEDLRYQVSSKLKRLVADLPDPELEDDE